MLCDTAWLQVSILDLVLGKIQAASLAGVKLQWK